MYFFATFVRFLIKRVKQNSESMKNLEREFEQMVRANRSTIYTVCYMFSNDQDEVADLFQEVLINLWKSCSWAPFIMILIILIAELIFNVWNTRSISTKYLMSDDVLTSRQRLLKFKQREQWQSVIEVPMIVLWGFWVYFDGPGRTSQNQKDWAVWFIIVFVIGLAIGFYLYSREMRSLNKAIKEIDQFANM